MSEAPLHALAPLLASDSRAFRYRPFGVMVSKEWFYAQGGRTVIYQEETWYDHLDVNLQYRHVRHELPSVDFTHEREWRLWMGQLDLDPAQTTIAVPTRSWATWLRQHHEARDLRKRATLSFFKSLPLSAFVWPSVLALEDLALGIDLSEYNASIPPS